MKVSDAGPIIVLFNTSLLWILRELHGEILIPEEVKNELLKKPEGSKIIEESWIHTKKVEKNDLLKLLTNLLDEGEAATISLANEKKSSILLDEKKGRRVAKALDLKIQGTL